MEQQVILVDKDDNEKGTAGKLEAHEKGWLHRAFSVFIFDSSGNMLLQQRAMDKYHSPGLWTNACCSHPHPGEDTLQAAKRRLKEELGFETGIEKIFDFVYKAEFENGLIEYEFDHVFAGEYEGTINPAAGEVMDQRYGTVGEIKKSLQNNPGNYTEWFKLAFPRVETWWKQRYKKSAV